MQVPTMKSPIPPTILATLLGLLLVSSPTRAQQVENYQLSEDSKVHEGVPQGEIKGPFHWKCRTRLFDLRTGPV